MSSIDKKLDFTKPLQFVTNPEVFVRYVGYLTGPLNKDFPHILAMTYDKTLGETTIKTNDYGDVYHKKGIFSNKPIEKTVKQYLVMYKSGALTIITNKEDFLNRVSPAVAIFGIKELNLTFTENEGL